MVIDTLIRTKRCSISIQISSQGNIIVHAPQSCSMDKIQQIIQQKQGWIELHQQRILQNRQLNNDIILYNKLLYLGVTYDIIFTKSVKNIYFEDKFYINLKYKDDIKKQIKIINKFMIDRAGEILADRVLYFSNLMQIKPNSTTLCNSKRVWGSCDRYANIKLNWRLIMLPPDLIDYVVVHELSHILQFNHSQLFWKLVASIIPNFKERRKLLKKGDFLLSLYRK